MDKIWNEDIRALVKYIFIKRNVKLNASGLNILRLDDESLLKVWLNTIWKGEWFWKAINVIIEPW
jgi:hypothetical protein